jgi:nitric oxide synthase oxygenase domain/subunit
MFFCPAKLFQGRGMRLSALGIRCVHFKKPERIAEQVARKVPSGLWSWLLISLSEPGRMYFFLNKNYRIRDGGGIPYTFYGEYQDTGKNAGLVRGHSSREGIF